MNADKYKISESVKRLLKSPSFMLWCYDPTEESDIWWNNWMCGNTERKNDVDIARKILLSAELNKFTFSEIDRKNLLSRIETSVKTRKRRRGQRHIIYGVAAIGMICFVLSGLWLSTQQKYVHDIFVNNVAVIDSAQTEIELKLRTQEKLLIANKSTIKLDEQGVVLINDDEIKEDHLQQTDIQNATNTNMNILKVPKGRHTMLNLADGSRVWVNSETVLQFPDIFAESHRTIYADGEIYLEVAKDTSRPFYVKTSEMNIRVLGTSFNVTAYNDETNQSVVLKEGSVEVGTSGGIKQMQPYDRLVLENNQVNISKVNPHYYISWIDGVLLSEKESLKHIAQRLSRYYKMTFICAPEVENYKCTGKLVLFDDMTKVLNTLEEGTPVSTEINGDTIFINLKH